MAQTPEEITDIKFQRLAIDTVIRIGILFALVSFCFDILRPFIYPIIWGMIIAAATHGTHQKLQTALGGRNKLAATLVTLIMLTVLIVPVIVLAESMAEGITALADEVQAGTLKVPPPPETIKTWPLVGEQLDAIWQRATKNIAAVVKQFAPQFKAIGSWLLSAAAGAGVGILQFIFAIIISGIFLATSKASSSALKAFATRLAGNKGMEFVDIAGKSVNGVTRGILGVALIQAILAGIAFLVVGIPGAGLWAFFTLLLAVIQVGILPVTLPAVLYVFSVSEPVTAVLFTIWIVIVSVMDNVLKPLLMGKGAAVPIPIIFLGAIGGFIAAGIIGLFIGAIVLSIGYTLYLTWVADVDSVVADETTAQPDET
jgi:predicted PurR-regulated permease PerM